jgi:hypothetical protein
MREVGVGGLETDFSLDPNALFPHFLLNLSKSLRIKLQDR